MKGKIKFELHSDNFSEYLRIYLKLENEFFYKHSKIVIDREIWDGYMRNFKSKNVYYQEVIDFISNLDKVKQYGEDYMKEVVNKQIATLKANSKEKEAQKLLQQFSKPIEIEIKI